MIMIRKDITGQRFGILYVTEFLRMKGNHSIYKCICDCGKETEVYANNLKRNHTTSCGCLSDKNKEAFSKIGLTHGLSKHPLFTSWIGMRNRCYFEKHNRFEHYGGSGIEVCPEWRDDFMAFYNWGIANGWEKGLSIDRKENDKNYCPDNCQFSTVPEQNNNRTSCVFLAFNGQTKNISQWAKFTGTNYGTMCKRIKMGWCVQDIILGKSKKL